MSRFKEGDVVDIWWHYIDGNGYKTGKILKILDDVNAIVQFDGWTPCKCYIDRALPHREYDIMGDAPCNDTK